MTTTGKEIVVIFEGISDVILTTSFDKCYKFLKEANEIDADPRIAALFLILRGVHKDKLVNIVRSLFQNHFVIDGSQLSGEVAASLLSSQLPQSSLVARIG